MPEVPGPDASENVADRMDFAFGRNFDFRIAFGSPNEAASERAELGVHVVAALGIVIIRPIRL